MDGCSTVVLCGWIGWDWKSLGGVRYRAPYSANGLCVQTLKKHKRKIIQKLMFLIFSCFLASVFLCFLNNILWILELNSKVDYILRRLSRQRLRQLNLVAGSHFTKCLSTCCNQVSELLYFLYFFVFLLYLYFPVLMSVFLLYLYFAVLFSVFCVCCICI